MGYTHYWRKTPNLNSEKFTEFSNKAKILIENEPVQFEYDSNKEPEITNELVRFNGIGENGHETFYFEKDVEKDQYYNEKNGKCFSFCKTARKPYDQTVVACLILAKKIFGKDINVSSDGTIEEWEDGLKLLNEKLEYDVKIVEDVEGNIVLS